MKNLIDNRKKILLLLTFVLLVNVSGFAQKKKSVTPKKTVKSDKVENQTKRRIAVYLKDSNVAVGTFVSASSEGIQILITENRVFLKWKDIMQILFMDVPAENYPPQDQKMPVKMDEINKKPFEDIADEINSRREKGEIDLSRNFIVVLDGTITADGKLDPKKSKFLRSEGDEEWVRVAKSALQALGDSGALGYLREKGIEQINITLGQNDNELYAIVLSDMKSPEKAATVASGLNTLLAAAMLMDNNGVTKLDEMSKVLLNNSKITSEGRNFRLDFKLPKKEARDLIEKTLNNRAETKKPFQ